METLEDIKWVDTHCHLQLMGDEINENDISNLEYFIIPGIDIKSSIRQEIFHLLTQVNLIGQLDSIRMKQTD